MTAVLCAAGQRCVWFDRREQLPAEVDDGPLCEGELLAGERAVAALVLDFRDLEQHIPRPVGSRGDGQPGRPDEHPLPINVAVADLQSEIHRVLTTWEDVVREADKLSESITRQVRNGWAVQAAAQVLRPRVRLLSKVGPVTLVGYPQVDDDEAHQLGSLVYADLPGWRGVLDFVRLHAKANRLLGLTAAQPEPCWGVPCRVCDLTALVRDPGEDTVHCGACHERYTAGQYRDWVKLLGAHVQASADTPE